MNNLKRVLSLALSGIMLVGMMAVGAGAADFSDADEIQHTDAVNTMVALKIIDGQDDGTFNPEGNVTRAQMAKMIAVAMNGGKNSSTGVKGTATFTDIKGHWAESYIEYCADLNIISGRGDGTFDPEGKVTGIEATKMVLTALGYDAKAYELTGPKWATQTHQLALQADPILYEDLGSVVMTEAATRDTAAQLIWNGLQNHTIRVTPGTNKSDGTVTWDYNTTGPTLLKERYDADVWVGTYDGNADFGTSKAGKGEITVNGRNEGDVGSDGKPVAPKNAFVPSDLDISNVGEEVKVIYKDSAKSGTKGRPDKQDTIYGVFNTGKSGTVSSTMGDVKNNKNNDEQVNVGGDKYDLAKEVTVWTNYATKAVYTKAGTVESGATKEGNTTVGKDAVNGKGEDNSQLTKDLKLVNGSTLKLVMNDEDEVETIYVTGSKIAKVTAKNSTKVTLSGGIGTLDIADNDIYEDIAKDDIVVVTTLYHTTPSNDDAFNIVEEAEKISGVVKSFKDNDKSGKENRTKTVTLDDGKTYKIVNEDLMDKNVHDDAIEVFDAEDHIGEEFDLYLVNGYVAAAVQTSESNSNYSLVTQVSQVAGTTAGNILDGLKIQVMGADGKKTVLTVSEDSYQKDGKTKIEDKDDIHVGDIVTYSLNKDGDADVDIEETYNAKNAKASYSKKTKDFDGDRTSSNCVLFVTTETSEDGKTKSNFKAYNIRDLGDVEVAANDGLTVVKDGTDVVAIYANIGKRPSGASSNTFYGIVSAYVGRFDIDDTRYYRYTVDVNDEHYTVNMKNRSLTTGDVVKLEPTSDEIYDNGECVVITKSNLASLSGVMGYVTDYSEKDGTITLSYAVKEKTDANGNTYFEETGKSATYAIDGDTKLYFVDKDGEEGVMGTIAEFDAIEGKANVIVIVDTDKKTATEVIIETSNKKDILS